MSKIIDRQIESKEYAKLLNEISNSIDRCVDYGDFVLDVIQKQPRNEFIDSSVTLIFRDYLELLDAVSVLVKNSCIEAAIPLLRSMFEHFLAIIYILDKHQEDRAASYHVAHIRARLKDHKKLSKDNIGEFRKKLDLNDYHIDLPDVDTSDAIEKLESLLLKGKYKRINDEWVNTRRRTGRKDTTWYSIFNGPPTLYELAKKMKRIGEYEILYRHWSSKTHANSAFNNALASGGIKALRHPESLNMVGAWSFSWTFFIFRKILNYYQKRKEKNFSVFYTQVRKLYLQLTNGKDLIKVIYD